jgi:two-component system, chemotaxis family, CheB/CheR fusion protein
VVITFVDVTERKQAEEETRAARKYAESIVETLHEPLLVLTPDLRVKSANPAFYEQFQVRPEQTEGRLIYELGNNQWDIPELWVLLEAVLPENNIFTDYEVSHEFQDIGQRIMRLNGRRLDHVQLILLAIEDVTERKQAEERLHYQAHLLANINDVVVATDEHLSITAWNQAAEALYGWQADQVLGRKLLEVIRSELTDTQRAEELRSLAETGYNRLELVQYHKDGQPIYVETSTTVFYGADRAITGYVAVNRDITQRKQTEEELRRAHDELEQRVQERTRELRETNAALLTEIAERERVEAQLRQVASRLTLAEQEERHRISQVLHDDLQQLLYGIQLKIGLISQGVETGEREPLLAQTRQTIAWIDDTIRTTRQLVVDLSPPVLHGEGLTDALSWLVTQMKEIHGLHVEVEAEQSFPITDEAMRVLLFQVIRELLFNVVKHAETDRAIVTLREEEGRLVIHVSDEGRGFELEAVKAERENGFGLRSIHERLSLFGGRMEITSQPGQGTWVIIYTPLTLKQRS